MISIEDYWEDITVYYVEFTSFNKEHKMSKHRKTLVFSSDVIEEDIYALVRNRFSNIIDVTKVDVLEDGLCLKKEFENI